MNEPKNFQPEDSECLAQIAGEQATRKRRIEDSISPQQKFEGQEKDVRSSKRAEGEPFVVGFPDIIANNMPKSAINITKHTPGVHGSSYSFEDSVSCPKLTQRQDVELDETSSSSSPLSSDEDTAPISSFEGDLRGEDFFARVKAQLQDAQTPGIADKSPALKMSEYSAEVLDKTKAEVRNLLMRPLHEVVLPENYSILGAALPIFASSPGLSVEKARGLEELENNLPSVYSCFRQVNKQKEGYQSKVDNQDILVDELTKGLEQYNDVKHRRRKIDTSIYSIRSQISKLEARLKEEERERRCIQEEELDLKNKNSPKLATLEELEVVLVSEKELADSLDAKAEVSWADYKKKIIDLEL